MTAPGKLIRLGDVCRIEHGYAFKGEDMQEGGEGPIVVNIGNFRYDGGFRFDSTRIQRTLAPYPKSFELAPDDIILIMTCQTPGGEILGVPARIPGNGRTYLHNQRMGKVVITQPGKVDADYLYYLFLSQAFNQHLTKTATGSKILHTAPGRIESYCFNCPAIDEQRSVGRALRAIDDLIENNRRRIRLLDEAIRILFDKWIVSKYQQAELACDAIPPSWSSSPASSVATYLNGYAFKPDDFSADGVPIIKIRELKSGVDASTPRYEGDLDEKYRVRAGDLLFSWSADLNVYIWAGDDGWLNQHLFVVRPVRGIPTSYLYLALAHAMPKFRALSNGATMKHIKRSALDQVSLLIAPPELRDHFASVADPMIELSIRLSRRNATLRKLRDLLLPKLLSGEIDVSRLPLPPEEPA